MEELQAVLTLEAASTAELEPLVSVRMSSQFTISTTAVSLAITTLFDATTLLRSNLFVAGILTEAVYPQLSVLALNGSAVYTPHSLVKGEYYYYDPDVFVYDIKRPVNETGSVEYPLGVQPEDIFPDLTYTGPTPSRF